MPGIATLPAYFKAGHMSQFTGLLLSVLIAFVLGIVLTYIAGFKEETAEAGMRNVENAEVPEGCETNIKAVSYTHLDVYKRQVSWHTGMPFSSAV